MTNTYKLKSGKVISEGQTITAEELTVAEFQELKLELCGGFRETSGDLGTFSYLLASSFPITIVCLPNPEPEAPLTVEAIMEGVQSGRQFIATKEGYQRYDIYKPLSIYLERHVIHALDPKNGWTVAEVV